MPTIELPHGARLQRDVPKDSELIWLFKLTVGLRETAELEGTDGTNDHLDELLSALTDILLSAGGTSSFTAEVHYMLISSGPPPV